MIIQVSRYILQNKYKIAQSFAVEVKSIPMTDTLKKSKVTLKADS